MSRRGYRTNGLYCGKLEAVDGLPWRFRLYSSVWVDCTDFQELNMLAFKRCIYLSIR